VVAGQIAGVIALWTQLYTFEEAVPRALAFAAWAVLLAAIAVLAVHVTPRRLSRFWERLDHGCERSLGDLVEDDEVEIVVELSEALRSQRERLRRAVRLSVALGLCGLAIAAVAYVVDKAAYPP
jgi:hypothetical protein